MYTTYWKLQERPFDDRSDVRFFYATQAVAAATLRLRYAIEHDQRGVVLCGPAGIGKTTLLARMRTMLPSQSYVLARVCFPELPIPEFLAEIAMRIGFVSGVSVDSPSSPTPEVRRSLYRIEQLLHQNAERGYRTLLVIEEAHRLTPPTIETLRLLLNLNETDSATSTASQGIFLILSGQPGLLPTLTRSPQFEERLAGRTLLPPFTIDETISYIAHRMRVAGAEENPFDTEAMEALHQVGGGIPRRINRIADMALLLGFAEELPHPDAEHIQRIAEDATFNASSTLERIENQV